VQLFVYGTLMVPEVIRGVCDYQQPGESAVLDGYRRRVVAGEVYPAIVPDPDEQVSGRLYRGLSSRQTQLLDAFEGEMYQRRTVSLRIAAGIVAAEAYVLRDAYIRYLSAELWSLEAFLTDGLGRFASEYQGFDRVTSDGIGHD
jgi:gamma-glutamylcyclotransferase (GGCT)/AIG2-like uncharacterized protein YtfP